VTPHTLLHTLVTHVNLGVTQCTSVPEDGHNITETNRKCCTWQQTFTIYCQFIIRIPLHSDQVRLRILLATNQINIPNQSALTKQCWRLTHTVPEKQPLPAGQWYPTCGSKLYCTGTDILTSAQVLILQPTFSLLMLSPVTVTVMDTMW